MAGPQAAVTPAADESRPRVTCTTEWDGYRGPASGSVDRNSCVACSLPPIGFPGYIIAATAKVHGAPRQPASTLFPNLDPKITSTDDR